MKIKDPTDRKRLVVLNTSLLVIFALLVLGSYWFGGVDFAKGTLVGCIVVAINFFVSQRLVGNLILEKSLNPILVIAYLAKLGVSILILFIAVIKLQVDVVGVMLGLSSVLFSSIATAFVRKQSEPQDELKS
ncbi:ATP synthase subunit I [bacterium]|nr:ATP synthase subunit I [bacterium]